MVIILGKTVLLKRPCSFITEHKAKWSTLEASSLLGSCDSAGQRYTEESWVFGF